MLSGLSTDTFTIRAMRLEDLTQVLKIERQSFSTPWSEDMFIQELRNPGGVLFVAEVEGRIAGYIVARPLGGGDSEIRDLAVGPNFRRRGIAKALLEKAFDVLRHSGVKKVYLEVRHSNTPARSLYLKMGFIPIGLRRNYYLHPEEDAILMERTLV